MREPSWWAHLQRAWWVPPAAWAVIACLDVALFRAQSYLVLGIIDEPAHLLSSLIDVLALAAAARLIGRRLPVACAAGALLAGNLIDADHLPGVLGSEVLTAGTPRPYSHSVLTVLVLLCLALLSRTPMIRALRGGSWLSSFWCGAALGVSGHLMRDLGTAPVAVFWPLTDRGYDYPHATYLAVQLMIALVPVAVGARVNATRGRAPEDPAPLRAWPN